MATFFFLLECELENASCYDHESCDDAIVENASCHDHVPESSHGHVPESSHDHVLERCCDHVLESDTGN